MTWDRHWAAGPSVLPTGGLESPELGHRGQTRKSLDGSPAVSSPGHRARWVPPQPGSPTVSSPAPPLVINHTVEVLTGLTVQLGQQPQRQRVSTRSRHHCLGSANPPEAFLYFCERFIT